MSFPRQNAASRPIARGRRPGRPVAAVTAAMSHPAVMSLPFPPRPAPAPAAISSALGKIEGVGTVLAEIGAGRLEWSAAECAGLLADLRVAYRLVRSLRAAG